MRHFGLPLVIILAGCVVWSPSASRAKDRAEPIVGTWELVGLGDAVGNVERPVRLSIVFDPSGSYNYRIWEGGDAEPFEISGDWTVKDNVLEMVPRDGEALKLTTHQYRVTWDGNVLVLLLVEEERHILALRFARKPVALGAR